MRIIVVTLEPPMPFGGAASRVYDGLFKGLVACGHEVSVFATCSRPQDAAVALNAFPRPRFDLRCYPHSERRGLRGRLRSLREPYSYMIADELRTDLQRELEQGFDVLHLEQLHSGWLGLSYPCRTLVNVHYLSEVDLRERTNGLQDLLEYALVSRTERWLLNSFLYIRALSERLAESIRDINPAADITSVPITLDTSLYPYVPDRLRPSEPIIGLIGSMRWYPTRSAAIHLLTRLYPAIKRRMPSAKFEIVGWSARSVLRDFAHLPDVQICENVPETRSYFERWSVMLYAPLQGTGPKLKVFEAMAYGTPVVTTVEGVEGLPAEGASAAGVSGDDDCLVDITVRLLKDPALQNRMRRNARDLLEAGCQPMVGAQQLTAIYQRMKSGAPSFTADSVSCGVARKQPGPAQAAS
jgi:glycosyltransferase involved in cell wall biosynthesis